MILNFSVRNFRSFAEESHFSMESPALRTNVPRAGQTWSDCTERVAGVYGANASGKSTFLEALGAVSAALRSPGTGTIFDPHPVSGRDDRTTEFEIDFVAAGVRHIYEVSASEWGVQWEALYAFPKGTRRMLFEREQSDWNQPMTFTKGASLSGPTASVQQITRAQFLFLGLAHKHGHPGVDSLSFRERQDEDVLRRVVMEMIAAPDSQVDLVQALLRAADLGIERVYIRKEEIPPEVLQRILRVIEAMGEGEELDEDRIPRLTDVVTFVHRGEDGNTFELPVGRQSSGTITWLTTAWHALDALRQGSVLLVDELDASLHPELVRYIVQLFLTPALNPHGAQLIFSTHDVSLLGNVPMKLLQPRNVWFVEKDRDGRSELYSLADFDTRPGNNTQRQYAAGQFGATPLINDVLIHRFIAAQSETADGAA
jgi:energy-coupling factor transporter ATP-binding protein EcfA2